MKQLILYLVILSVLISNNLQAQHLEPNESIFELSDSRYVYHTKVRNKLFHNLSDQPELRLVVQTSFNPEYVFQIEKDDHTSAYIARLNITSASVYHAENYDAIDVKTYVSKITIDDVRLLSNIYLNVIKKTHYPIKNTFGMDGVSYYISVWNRGLKSGTIWSPKHSASKIMLEVTKNLIAQMTQHQSTIFLSATDQNILRQTLKEIRQLPEITSYQLILEIKGLIDEHYEIYRSTLTKTHSYAYEMYLTEFQKKLLLQLTFGTLDKNFVLELLAQYQNYFEELIKFETYKKDMDDVEAYMNKHLNDNIFNKIKINIKD